MRKIEEYISKERQKYAETFSSIAYAQNELEPFLDVSVLKQRKYVSQFPVISRYMELLDSVQAESKKDGIMGFLKDNDYISVLEDYKKDHSDEFNQLAKCHKCQCLKCPRECEFDSCLGCATGSRVVQCDRKQLNVVKSECRIIPLNNDKTGFVEDFKVMATIQDISNGKRYIFLESLTGNDKYVLHYHPGISEDTYGEITDEQEFDRVIAIYQSIESE